MKSTIISMLIVLCVLAIAPLLLFGDQGLLARYGLDIFGEPDIRAKAPKNLTSVTTDKKVQVYRWRDQHGVMQFTNTPPPNSQQVEMVELRPDTNIVKAIEVPDEAPEVKRSGPKVMTTGNPYTPDGVKDLLDTTSGLAEGINEKQLQQQKLMEQIMRK
ncbi:MAG: DUF4124 domain-containing protein [Gammaproteobacteria bacterium]